MSLPTALRRGLRAANSATEALWRIALIPVVVYLVFTDPLRVIAFGVVIIAVMQYLALVRKPSAAPDSDSPEA